MTTGTNRKAKPQAVQVRLRYASLPFVSAIKRDWIEFNDKAHALSFTRGEATALLRRLRTWGGYHWDVTT